MSLPSGWTLTTLDSLLYEIESGKNMRCEERPPREGELGVVKVSAVTWGRFDPTQSKTLPSDYNPPEKARIQLGDLLISRANTLDLVGAVVLVETDPRRLFLSDKILRLVVDNDAKKWLLMFLRSKFGRKQIEELASGNQHSMRNISQDALRRIQQPLPPAAEQRRIVAKLDVLIARLAAARTELDRIATESIRLRNQAIDSAVLGLLLAHQPKETWSVADRLCIAARRSKYLVERKGSRLRSGLETDIDFLKEERSTWLDCRLADVISLRVGHAFKSSQFSDTGLPLLRGANVAPGKVDWTDVVRLPVQIAESHSALALAEGDIVLAMDRPVISSGLKIARVNAVDAGCLLVQRVANPRPTQFVLSDYLMLVLRSRLFAEQIADHATGSDLPHISSNDILTAPCPLPPLGVQQAIVDRIGKTIARADHVEAEAARARALLDRLEAAILAKAFKGELVPQDPNDEPASLLLDRIRARRAAAPKARRGRAAA